MEVIPTPLRLQHKYIIIYVNWIWSVATGILPFIILTILNIRIFIALRKVKRNLIKHNSSNSGTKSTTQSDINIPNKIAGILYNIQRGGKKNDQGASHSFNSLYIQGVS